MKSFSEELYHYGIKGMRWGVRRFQKKNGDLTSEGQRRYGSKTRGAGAKRRSKIENYYLRNGFTKEEAKEQVNKRIRTEKILAIAAGVTVASLVGYAAYKQYDKRVDKLIPSNVVLQRISTNNNAGVRDAFYASMKKLDNDKYRGIYGATLKTKTLSTLGKEERLMKKR